MVVVPGLSDLLDDVGKRIVHLNSVDAALSIEVAGCSRWARCPACSQGSSRWHGQYRRRLKAQPSLGQTVSLVVQVRRFKCVNSKCERKTFAEQIDALAAFKQRRTTGLGLAWRAMAQALGGSAAARLSVKLRMPASRDTLLRELRRMGSEATIPPPLVVGIDDWAITRGHRYGTIVVDLVRRCPIEVLDGRESTGVADWFRRHPSIKVVARDRAGAYSDAVETALPDARQVADRWHLLVNLRETVERLLVRHNTKLREAAQLAIVWPQNEITATDGEPGLPLLAWQRLSVDRRTARLGRYEEVLRHRARGLSYKAIGRAMNLDQRTVSRFVQAGEYPERSAPSGGPKLLDAYRQHLRLRVTEGNLNITELWQELRGLGFKGSRGTVRLAMAKTIKMLRSTDEPGRSGPRAATPSAQRAYGWLVGWDERGIRVPKSAEHHRFVRALCDIEPEIGEVSSIAREFLGLIHHRNIEQFDRWLKRARESKAREMRRFATGIAADLSAVRAAFELPWSSGQVEGQINRLKFLKRQMYGRANLDLLRARVLHPN